MPEHVDPETAVARTDAALRAIAAGGMAIIADDQRPWVTGELVLAAERVDARVVNQLTQLARGMVCVPLPEPRCDALDLRPMVPQGERRAYTVSVDAVRVLRSGASAAGRAETIRALADPATAAEDLSRPGHVFPVRARAGGVLERAAVAEGALDLVRLAGFTPAAVTCEIISESGDVSRGGPLRELARRHGLPLLTVSDVVEFRRRREAFVERAAEAALPTRHGRFHVVGYRSDYDAREQFALVLGKLPAHGEVLVYVHQECLLGDVASSLACPCRVRLDAALRRIEAAGQGVVVYLRSPRGELANRHWLSALQAHDEPARSLDEHAAAACAHILRDLGVASARFLTPSGRACETLATCGITVAGWLPLGDIPSTTAGNAHA